MQFMCHLSSKALVKLTPDSVTTMQGQKMNLWFTAEACKKGRLSATGNMSFQGLALNLHSYSDSDQLIFKS